jgi:hypothetical protein
MENLHTPHPGYDFLSLFRMSSESAQSHTDLMQFSAYTTWEIQKDGRTISDCVSIKQDKRAWA